MFPMKGPANRLCHGFSGYSQGCNGAVGGDGLNCLAVLLFLQYPGFNFGHQISFYSFLDELHVIPELDMTQK